MIHPNFKTAIEHTKEAFETAYPVENPRWQSTDVRDPGMRTMMEIFDHHYRVPLTSLSLKHWQDDIKPNLPWAEDHFSERVSGVPLNPGVQWANWPYAHSANRHRKEGQRFSHSYMERYWPKTAGIQTDQDREDNLPIQNFEIQEGIRYRLGDLNDVVKLLHREPHTRQAYLPVWFPEDTGVVHGERVPCTLGYHFLYREGLLHITYYIRSCDFLRHYRDDLYLTVRLLLWVLGRLTFIDHNSPLHPKPETIRWEHVRPGFFVFDCVSMHMFKGDWERLYGQN